jgi:hypothetical protein
MSFYELDAKSTLQPAQQLVAKDKDGAKQAEKVSDHGPGPVADDELLARSLEYPNKYLNTGGLNDSMFQDAFSFGASAQRLLPNWEARSADVHAGFEARAQARREGSNGRAAAPNNLYIGAFQMTAGELRGCGLDGDNGLRVRVYDHGEASDELHAEIVVDATGLGKPQRHELRVRLMTLAQQRGLYVSPHLPPEEVKRAEETQCALIMPPAA